MGVVSVSQVRERVIVNGFLIDCDIPTEERLAMTVDLSKLGGYGHVDWVTELQDLLRTIDNEYRKVVFGEVRTPSKRTVKVRYTKGEHGLRKVASFYPYPLTIVNMLKEVRRSAYKVLNEYCVVLASERVGRVVKKLYFLPASGAIEVMMRIQELNEELEGVWRRVVEFEESARFKEVMEHVRKVAGREFQEFSAKPAPIRVSPVPLSLSREFYTRFIEGEERRALAEIEEAKARGLREVEEARVKALKALEEEVERRRRELLEAVERDVKSRFSKILEALRDIIEKGDVKAAKKLDEKIASFARLVEGICAELPVEAARRVAGAVASKDAAAVASAVRELCEEVGAASTGDPARDVEVARRVLEGRPLWLMAI